MSKIELVIGTKRYSSWSLRPWLALKQAGLAFDEIEIPLRSPETTEMILKHSPSGKVPALRHGELMIWDSFAICEYVAELACAQALWPENRGARAVARAVSAEMHSGFQALRHNLPMDVCAKLADFTPPEDAQADIRRIQALWKDCRARFGATGDFLFGSWSLADAFYTPVVTRLETYGVKVDPVSRAYMDAVFALPAVKEWIAAAS